MKYRDHFEQATIYVNSVVGGVANAVVKYDDGDEVNQSFDLSFFINDEQIELIG